MRTTRNVFPERAIPTALISIIICGCSPPRPSELAELGVKKGEELYEKRLLIDLGDVLAPCEGTFVQDVRRVNGVGDSDVIAVLTDCAVLHVDLDSGTITSQKARNPLCDSFRFVDIESDGSLAVFCDRWSLRGFGLLDAEGEVLWLKEDETPGQVSNFEDLDGDGSLDFCARFEQSLACFNLATGDELWRENGEQYIDPHYFVDVFLSIVDGETTYVTAPICTVPSDTLSCGDDTIWLEVRNRHGTLIERISFDCDEAVDELCHLTRTRFPGRAVQLVPGPPLRLLDSEHRLLTEPETPPSAWLWRLVNAAVLPPVDGHARIGVFWRLGPRVVNQWGRQLFTIHNGDGDAIYEEVFGTFPGRFWTLGERSSPGESKPFLLTNWGFGFSELYLYQPTAPERDTMVNKDSLSGSLR